MPGAAPRAVRPRCLGRGDGAAIRRRAIRFGLKPLFFAEHGGVLYLASEAKALFAAGIPASWDARAVYHSLHACPDETRSLFAGISQVPPGHMLLAGPGGMRLKRYWDLPRSSSAGAAPGFPEAVARVRELTEEAVGVRMVAGVPVGCLLSGGLDSSSVLGVASAAAEGPVAAFTVGFERRRYDETAGARGMAEAAGAQHAVVTLDDAALADHFADAVWHAETLQYNTHGVARYLLARSVHEAGYRAVMAGEGADEAFFGYEFLRAAAGDVGRRGRGRLPGASSGSSEGSSAPPRGATRAWPPHPPGLARIALMLPAAPSLFNASRTRPRPPPLGMLGRLPRRPCRVRPLPRRTTGAAAGAAHSPAAPPRGSSSTSGCTHSSSTTTWPPTAWTWRTGSRCASPSWTTVSSSTPTASRSRS